MAELTFGFGPLAAGIAEVLRGAAKVLGGGNNGSGNNGSAAGATRSKDWPPKPDFKPLVSNSSRQRVFGNYKYEHDPTKSNPERIRILDNWESKNIVKITIDTGPHTGTKTRRVHRLVSKQMQDLWTAWKDAGLLDRVIHVGGFFVARFVRGSRRTLSNHAFGTAFDINVQWNLRKREPALLGEKGCVRELVPIANEHGFYWGGHFGTKDGMHFEVAKVM